MDWRDNLITKEEDILELAAAVGRLAVLGIRSEMVQFRPAYYVPKYMADAGVEVIPVPVYEPEVTMILGEKVYRKLVDIPGEIDMVDVFRRAADIPPHLPDIIASAPKAVWFQLGIRNDEAAEELASAGIKVVQNRCIMVDHRKSMFLQSTSS